MGDKCSVDRGLGHGRDVCRPFLGALRGWLLPLLGLLLVHPFQFPQLFGLPGCEDEQRENQVSTESQQNPGLYIGNGSRSIISKFLNENRHRTLNTSLPAALSHWKKDKKTPLSSFSLLCWMFLYMTECPVSASIQTCRKHPSYCGRCQLNISELQSLITYKTAIHVLPPIWSSKEMCTILADTEPS